MKKLIMMFVLVLGINTITQAQKKGNTEREPLSVAQKTTLAVKKMILKLDLTDSQAKQVKPLIEKRIEERFKMHEKRKARKETDKKMTADERFAIENKKLDNKIAFKKKMKQILNEEQFKKYEKMAMHKKGKHGGKRGKPKNGETCNKEACQHKKK